ncbi:MAG: DNA-binding protein [Rhodospirillaceae bacterium]|nr:DNA-binding protein [Rhodospirillaceae bacterium]
MKVPYPLPTKTPYSGPHVRKLFRAAGVTIAEWAKANGYTENQVYDVTGGQLKGTRGISHEIALKLGMKLPVEKICA